MVKLRVGSEAKLIYSYKIAAARSFLLLISLFQIFSFRGAEILITIQVI